jgi:FADH2 O2-dependent halogenase
MTNTSRDSSRNSTRNATKPNGHKGLLDHSPDTEVFDVAILGAGIGGSMLAALCARHGVKVLLAEESSHPRFAIGESTVPQTVALYRVIGARYDVPEVEHLGTFMSCRHHVSLNCGVKRGFSYVYHRKGELPKADECTQAPTVTPPLGPDIHFYRQDTDQYMFNAAVKYGACARMLLKIDGIERGGPGWILTSSKGERFEAKYIVDAGGMKAPLAMKFGLRDEPTRLLTNTRSMFAHMVGVIPYDQVGPSRQEHGLPYPFHETTLHHLFDGGWVWVIPFDNYPDSTNPLVSVGVTLDRTKFPDTGKSPAEEFAEIARTYPGIAKQFNQARLAREWVKVGARLQYSSKQIVGDRFCLIPHAAGLVDPLFSSGLAMTITFVGSIAGRLIEASRANDFSTKRFSYLDGWLQRTFDQFDRLVHLSYISWEDFDLWNAWFRVWALGTILGSFGPVTLYIRAHNDRSLLAACDAPPYRGLAASDLAEYAELFEACATRMEAYRDKKLSAQETTAEIYKILADCKVSPPQIHIADPKYRGLNVWTFTRVLRLYAWGYFFAGERMRKFYFDEKLLWYVPQVWWDIWREIKKALRTAWAAVRDVATPRNFDWKHPRYALVAKPKAPPMLSEEQYEAMDEPYVRPCVMREPGTEATLEPIGALCPPEFAPRAGVR